MLLLYSWFFKNKNANTTGTEFPLLSELAPVKGRKSNNPLKKGAPKC